MTPNSRHPATPPPMQEIPLAQCERWIDYIGLIDANGRIKAIPINPDLCTALPGEFLQASDITTALRTYHRSDMREALTITPQIADRLSHREMFKVAFLIREMRYLVTLAEPRQIPVCVRDMCKRWDECPRRASVELKRWHARYFSGSG